MYLQMSISGLLDLFIYLQKITSGLPDFDMYLQRINLARFFGIDIVLNLQQREPKSSVWIVKFPLKVSPMSHIGLWKVGTCLFDLYPKVPASSNQDCLVLNP